ncbi:MAG: hypothetical protein DRI39_09295 [Chloroflexi bacterium]|nr:MAG: hypothetical protein DRI39_09295 [Chloroflexota bacterium]
MRELQQHENGAATAFEAPPGHKQAKGHGCRYQPEHGKRVHQQQPTQSTRPQGPPGQQTAFIYKRLSRKESDNHSNESPRWSPDRARIAFVSYRNPT